MIASIPWGAIFPILAVKSTGLSSLFAHSAELLVLNVVVNLARIQTFLDKSESVGDAALVGNKQQTTIMLGHTAGLLIVQCQWSVGNSPSQHKMLLVIGEVISRPTLPDVGSVRTFGLVLRVVSEGIRVIYLFQLFKFRFGVFILLFPLCEQLLLVLDRIGVQHRRWILVWVKFKRGSCTYQISECCK